MVPLAIAATSASAAPVRTATLTDYTSARYLQDTLGLSTADADPAIDTITYAHFNWLLQHPGQYAVLIGDPATDARFVERAQDVEAAARAAGVDTVYWFNPNLSGSARVAGTRQPGLDIRDPAGIASLTSNSQRSYGYAWQNLVARSLGNGVAITSESGVGGGAPVVTTEPLRPEVVNDSGAADDQSTEVGDPDGGALYDYSATATPADVSDTYFFVFDKDARRGGQTQKIVSWVNLSEKADSSAARADVTTAIGTVGGANLDAPAQFEWWKADVNGRQSYNSSTASNGDIPVLTDADADWRIEQITYPELIHLLENDATAAKDAVILLGGAWCPNTRPVLPAINKNAQDNDVRIFNFDTVLDGASIAGGATSGSNPFQSRNPHVSGNHPSNLYGHLFDHYIQNAKTQYTATSNTISYFPDGDRNATEIRTRRLQVPYLFSYRGRGRSSPGPHDGVTRQWIQDNGNGAYREYMTSWPVANPLPNRLGLPIPLDAPIWATINDQLARFTYQTDPAPLYPNTGTEADNTDYLVPSDQARVAYVAASGNRPSSVRVTSEPGISNSPAALATALSNLGAAAPANYVAARAAYIAAYEAPVRDTALLANLETVVGAWGVAQGRKTNVINAWGTVAEASGVAGGLRAIRAAELFFGGLPGGVVSTQTVTADTVKQGTAPTISVAISNEYGRVPTGNVSLVVTQGGQTVTTGSTAVANGSASFTLPALSAGTYDYALSYQGDEQILGFAKAGNLTVTPPDEVVTPPPPGPPAPPVVGPPPVNRPPVVTRPPVRQPVAQKPKARKVSGGVAKAPTSRRGGSYKVTIAVPKGAAAATGRVKITLKKGKATKTVSGRLVRGTVTLKVPKLAKGTWRVTISWPGDARYRAVSFAGTSIKVTK